MVSDQRKCSGSGAGIAQRNNQGQGPGRVAHRKWEGVPVPRSFFDSSQRIRVVWIPVMDKLLACRPVNDEIAAGGHVSIEGQYREKEHRKDDPRRARNGDQECA